MAPSKQFVRKRSNLDFGGVVKFLYLMIAASAPLFYMAGKVYHEGYLAFFSLKPSMFPMDIYETFSTATMALIYAILGVFKSISEFLDIKYKALFIIFIALFLGVLLFRYAVRTLSKKIDSWHPSAAWSPRLVFWIEEICKCLAWVVLPFYCLLVVMLFVAVLLVLMLAPFESVGWKQAEEDLRKEFVRSPVVRVATPEAEYRSYRIMECSSSFCALYRRGEVITLPLADIKWGVSDVRGKSNLARCWRSARLEQHFADKSVYPVVFNLSYIGPFSKYFLGYNSRERLSEYCRYVDMKSDF
ncbi:hypothetical protein ACW9I4_02725 [Pseudomonas sp. SDT2931_S440]